MGNEQQTPPTPDGQTPQGVDPNGQTPTPQSQTQSGSDKTPISSLPADVQDYIRQLRSEAEVANEKVKTEARAKKQAEEQRLAEQGEYKKLAEQHEAKVNELTPIAERYSKLSETLHEQIKAQVKEWPEEVKSLVPTKDIPIEERLVALEKLKPLVEKLALQARGSNPGNSPNPKPAPEQAPDLSEDYTRKLLGSGKYPLSSRRF